MSEHLVSDDRAVPEAGRRRFDVAAIAMVLVGAWIACPPGWIPGLAAPDVYVSPDGSNWNSGRSSNEPVQTIAEALRRVSTGGRVWLLEGIYRERVHVRKGGTPNQPLTIAAEHPGQAVLTWSCEEGLPLRSDWRPEGDGIYSALIAWPQYWIRDGDESLLRLTFGGLEGLRKIARRPGHRGAFVQIGDELFVCLSDGRKPENLVGHREAPLPGEWGEHKSANLWLEADHLRISGIRFEFGIGSGIRVWDADDVLIDDCAFSMATAGIRADAGASTPSQLRLERCLYENYPQGEWLHGWLSWAEIYGWLSNTSLIRAPGMPINVSQCVAVHCADALQVSPTPGSGESRVSHNWIGFTSDDAIELDGSASHLTIDSNLMYDCFVGLACSPVKTGPMRALKNVSWNDASWPAGAHLKFKNPWHDAHGRVAAIRNVTVNDSLFVGKRRMYWAENEPLESIAITDVLFVDSEAPDRDWPRGITETRVRSVALAADERPTTPEIAKRIVEPGGWSVDRFREIVGPVCEVAGPSWWRMKSHAATRDLAEFVDELRSTAE
jgi:hypothetical protein